uniref:Uncharacterized protein n=2 Tax=Caenorhabditis japonica TaxID=281687 RepID=A0A8R1E3K6_CAEJA
MNMGSMGLSNGFGTFGTGMENLYGAQNAFAGAYNPYGNGLFNFGLQQMLQPAQNLFSPQNTMAPPTFAPIQQQQQQQQIGQSSLNNGNTLRAYGRRTQNFNNYAPTRVGQGGCNGGFGGCGNQNGWQTKAKV